MLTVHVTSNFQADDPKIILHETEAQGFEGRLAICLVEKWGMVSAAEGGEDSTGRAKLRLMTPDEVVERACATADLLAKSIRARGWTIQIPSYDEAKKEARANRERIEDEEISARAKRAADRAERSGPK